MPAALSFPGVYIDEIPSGVRTITGVPTAICAFIGRTVSGPVDTPIILNSFGDFERIHGGLNVNYPVSYSVRDFFLNSGAQAIMVRLYGTPAMASPPTSPPSDTVGGIAKIRITAINGADAWELRAASPGTWANTLRVRVVPGDPSVAAALGFPLGTEVFDLIVSTPDPNSPGQFIELERTRNLTFIDTARKMERVLPNESRFILVSGTAPNPIGTTPNPSTILANYVIAPGSPPNPQLPVTTLGADSQPLVSDGNFIGSESEKTGMNALLKADLFNLLCIPPDARSGEISGGVRSAAADFCAKNRAMFIVDPPTNWTSVANVITNLGGLNIAGVIGRNAAVYFPRILQADPLRGGQLDTFVACGTIAGAIASTDARRGVFKAAAGIDVGLVGVRGLSIKDGSLFTLTDQENGQLNPLGVNCLRVFPVIGPVSWGARTVRGADALADDYKYLPVRRTALFIEESLMRGTKFAVFEPNDEPLWSQLRLNIGAFMQGLFRQGAFQGSSPQAAYFVKCDKETTTQNDINLGIVNIIVGFAPLKPAEFVVIKIQQIAGQIAT